MPIWSPGRVAGQRDGFEHHLERFLVGLEVGRETALVADGGRIAALLEHALKRVEHFRAPAQRFREFFRAVGDDHELLRVDAVVGVRAAVEDVHHGHRQDARADAAEITVQRRLLRDRRGARGGHRHGQNRVCAEPGFVGRAVERDHQVVDRRLAFGVRA